MQHWKVLPDDKLLAEYYYWNDIIVKAPSWGAAVGAADEFRTECLREIEFRGLSLNG